MNAITRRRIAAVRGGKDAARRVIRSARQSMILARRYHFKFNIRNITVYSAMLINGGNGVK